MRWTDQQEKDLLILALAQAPNFAVDAEKIRASWPRSGEIPTPRAVKDRLSKIRKNSNVPNAANAGKANHGGGSAIKEDSSSVSSDRETFGEIPFPASKIKDLDKTRKTTAAKPTTPPNRGTKRKAAAAVDSESEEAELTVMESTEDDDGPAPNGTRIKRSTPRRSVTRTTYADDNDGDEAMDGGELADDSEDAYDPVKERGEKLKLEQKMAKKRGLSFVKDEELED